MRRYPDFLIIGAARSGTSSLHRNLETHPDIIGPKLLGGNQKEAHFFDKSIKFNRGLPWYLSIWPDFETVGRHLVSSTNPILKFESTPNYLYVKEVPGRIKDTLPNWKELKFIVLLRDPVMRAWSHFYHWREKHKESQEALMNPETEWVKKGLYLEQLQNWHYYFKKEQFLILQSELFFRNPIETFRKVFKFLGLTTYFIERAVYFDPKKPAQGLKTSYPGIPGNVSLWLRRYYKPYNEELFRYLGRAFEGWS